MQVNSDGSVMISDGITLDKDSFLRLIGGIIQQLGQEQIVVPLPEPEEVKAINDANVIRNRYKQGDYTYPQLMEAVGAFKTRYPDRLHFLVNNWALL